jgi:hypothetical protein
VRNRFDAQFQEGSPEVKLVVQGIGNRGQRREDAYPSIAGGGKGLEPFYGIGRHDIAVASRLQERRGNLCPYLSVK